MDVTFLDILRCPFCGSGLRLQEGSSLDQKDGDVRNGLLECQCCAYPVVGGIPYIRTGAAAEAAMGLLGRGEKERALSSLLGLDEAARDRFARSQRTEGPATFREALEVLSPNAEGAYLLYRFSDPTYLCSQAVLRAVGQDRRCFARRVLDLCGGTGHLTRTFCTVARSSEVVLADVSFWKLWLAKRFLAPDCQPVCWNANEPAPFARDAFSLVFCSDAFHYVWSRRLLASEMLRLVGPGGTVVLSHLHNLLCYNESAGMPLAPADYRNLFEDGETRLFKESDVFAALLKRRPLDLSARYADEDLSQEAALLLVTTRLAGLFGVYEMSAGEATRPMSINPLYRRERDGEGEALRLRFPSAGYEAEYRACKQYLPERVVWNEEKQARLQAGILDEELRQLAERSVLLELPQGY